MFTISNLKRRTFECRMRGAEGTPIRVRSLSAFAPGFNLVVQEPGARRRRVAGATDRRPASGEPFGYYRHDQTRKNNPPAGLIDLEKPPPKRRGSTSTTRTSTRSSSGPGRPSTSRSRWTRSGHSRRSSARLRRATRRCSPRRRRKPRRLRPLGGAHPLDAGCGGDRHGRWRSGRSDRVDLAPGVCEPERAAHLLQFAALRRLTVHHLRSNGHSNGHARSCARRGGSPGSLRAHGAASLSFVAYTACPGNLSWATGCCAHCPCWTTTTTSWFIPMLPVAPAGNGMPTTLPVPVADPYSPVPVCVTWTFP